MTSQDSLQNQAVLELMARLRDPKWALEAAKIEDEANCNISAGRDWGDLLGQFVAEPDGVHQFSRLRTLGKAPTSYRSKVIASPQIEVPERLILWDSELDGRGSNA